jgi:uncharacterized protein (DUF2267 family)
VVDRAEWAVRRMDYADLLQQTQTAAALDRATAERVIWATVVTLAERMSHEELVRVSRRLPKELQAALRAGSPTCQPFGADEFVGRVAERVGVEPQAAWTHVRAVLGTLEREVAEMEAVRVRLPREFDALMA